MPEASDHADRRAGRSFVVGLDEERGFLVERFEDPERVVIDVFHDE